MCWPIGDQRAPSGTTKNVRVMNFIGVSGRGATACGGGATTPCGGGATNACGRGVVTAVEELLEEELGLRRVPTLGN
jgi:hypothetical protein